jgi:hypothetical protein
MSDISVNSVEFASEQEPDNEEDFVTLVRANYTVRGKKLAQILEKQTRVLEKNLIAYSKSDQSKKMIMTRITEDDDVLVVVSKAIRQFVRAYLIEEVMSDDGYIPRISVENAEESDLPYTIRINPYEQSVTVETEFDVMSDN